MTIFGSFSGWHALVRSHIFDECAPLGKHRTDGTQQDEEDYDGYCGFELQGTDKLKRTKELIETTDGFLREIHNILEKG